MVAPRYGATAKAVVVLFLVMLSALVAVSLTVHEPLVHGATTASGVGAWTETTDYGSAFGTNGSAGIQIVGNSCVGYQNYVYCVGGQSEATGSDLSSVFYAEVNSSGALGPWFQTTDYGSKTASGGTTGVGVEWPSCAQNGGYIYCVAGASSAGGVLADVYFAKLSTSGIGAWTETTDFGAESGTNGQTGFGASQLSCVAYGGYIYCVGGSNLTSKTYFAQVSSNGVGQWAETTDYGTSSGTDGSGGVQISSTSCAADNGYIYCVGGVSGFNPVSDVFSAPISASGIGPWTEETDYAAASGVSSGHSGSAVYATNCVSDSGTILCVGGERSGFVGIGAVYSTSDSLGTLGNWAGSVGYPQLGDWRNCAISSGFVLCTGGGTSSTYSAPAPPAVSSSSSASTSTTTTTSTSSNTFIPCAYTAIKSGGWTDPTVWTPTPVSPFPTTIPTGCSVTTDGGITLTIPVGTTVLNQGSIKNNAVLDNYGTIENSGGISNLGTINNYGTISGTGTLTGVPVVTTATTTSTVPEFPPSNAAIVMLVSVLALAILASRMPRSDAFIH